MKTAGIIIDFDNIFKRPISHYSDEDIKRVLTMTIGMLRDQDPDIECVRIRLYGGWYQGNNMTQKASVLSSMIPAIETIFPILNPPQKVIGSIELATTLYMQTHIWYDSYKEKAGIPTLRIDDSKLSVTCQSHPDMCPVKILRKFTEHKSKICHHANCDTNHSEVFFEREQKYVDSMMVCDVIAMSMDSDISVITALTDDVDLFPSFSVANMISGGSKVLNLVTHNSHHEALYQSILNEFNINVKLITVE